MPNAQNNMDVKNQTLVQSFTEILAKSLSSPEQMPKLWDNHINVLRFGMECL
jgi:hypothetical protein